MRKTNNIKKIVVNIFGSMLGFACIAVYLFFIKERTLPIMFPESAVETRLPGSIANNNVDLQNNHSVDPLPQIVVTTAPEIAFQELFLRPSCGKSYKVEAHKPINLSYGAWAASTELLLRQTVDFIKVDLYVDEKRFDGIRLNDFVPMSDIPCGDYLDGAFFVLHNATIDSLAPGKHEIKIVYSFIQNITDGYDLNGDGKSDTYGPDSSFYQKYTITSILSP